VTGQGSDSKTGRAATPRDPAEIREKLVWRAAVVMLLAVTGWLFYVAFDAREQVEELEAELAREDPAESQLTRLGLSTEAVRRFEAAGVEATPETFLLDDLERRTEWLLNETDRLTGPVEIDRDGSAVLSDHWVFVRLRGQERQATLLLAFHLQEDSELEWEVLAKAIAD